MPIVLIPCVLANYVLHKSIILDCVSTLFKNIVLKMVSNAYISSTVLNFLFIFATQPFKIKKMQKFVYRTVNLYRNLSEFISFDGMTNCLRYAIQFAVKTFVIAIISAVYLAVSMSLIGSGLFKFYMLPAFILPVFVNKFYPDIYFGGMLLVDFFLCYFNNNLKEILFSVTDPDQSGNTQSFVDIAEHVETLSINYIELIEIVKEFNEIMSSRVVTWIMLTLLNFLIHLFMEYVFMLIPLRHGHSLNVIISASGVIDLLCQFLELWTISTVCNSVLKRVEETKNILSAIDIHLLLKDRQLARSVMLRNLILIHIIYTR